MKLIPTMLRVGIVLVALAMIGCEDDSADHPTVTKNTPTAPAPEAGKPSGPERSGILDVPTGGSSSVPGKARDAVSRTVDKMKERDKAIQKQIDDMP